MRLWKEQPKRYLTKQVKGEYSVGQLFEVKDIDRIFYEQRIRDFLPEKIIDVHTHVWLDSLRLPQKEGHQTVAWPDRVAKDNSIDDLMETYRLMFPDKSVVPMIFSTIPGDEHDVDGLNDYVNTSAKKHDLPALIWSLPQWNAEELEQRVLEGGFLGIKSYLTQAPSYLPTDEIRIFDYFPNHHLEVLNRHGWIMMLHLPRPGRLGDPVNLAQIVEIEKRYPNNKLIIAHVGRAYCPEDVGGAFEILGETENIMFDISANTHAGNFEKLIRAVGPKRIMFGSDMPISRMRMRRVCESGRYVNIVPRGHYGDVSCDKNMREIDGPDADKLTFFIYEEIDAFRQAAETTHLTRADIEDVFHNNAAAIIDSARPSPEKLKMVWPQDKMDKPPMFSVPDEIGRAHV